MSAVLPVLGCFLAYFLAYRFYSRFLAERIFALDDSVVTPAHTFRNDIDFLPTNRFVLFGHHFASITGLSPMLGPAIAVIWGWGPAMVWVVLGAIVIGCVHDFSAVVLSIRAKGQSIGKVAEGVVGRRAKALFLAIIFFGVALAMGVFTLVIASLFSGQYGSAVIPCGGLMIVAAVIGFLFHRKGARLGPLTVIGFVLQIVLVWLGAQYPITWTNSDGWKYVLLTYAFLASVLPVWSLLQPRDFLNSLLLYLGLILCFAGFFISAPEFAAPVFDASPEGAPPFYPFVFITIACGAASGFHSLVSSGTTAKQLNKESDARIVGFGGMIGESLLGLLAVLATTAGVSAVGNRTASEVWAQDHYHGWNSASGLGAKMSRFIDGAASFIEELGIPVELAQAFIAVVVVSFALTTLDSATRLLRYNVEEIGSALRIPQFGNRYVASLIAVFAIAFFAFYKINGRPAGQSLWQIFGTVNQLLAGLALMVATLYLINRGRNPWFTGIPMVFMLVTTVVAMFLNLKNFTHNFTFVGTKKAPVELPLVVVAILLAILTMWLILEAVPLFVR
ncbi:MAG: carbon starvation protein, partial [Planctomycetota bacterium]